MLQLDLDYTYININLNAFQVVFHWFFFSPLTGRPPVARTLDREDTGFSDVGGVRGQRLSRGTRTECLELAARSCAINPAPVGVWCFDVSPVWWRTCSGSTPAAFGCKTAL